MTRERIFLMLLAVLSGLMAGCGHEPTAPVHRTAIHLARTLGDPLDPNKPAQDTGFIDPYGAGSGNPLPSPGGPCVVVDSIPLTDGSGRYTVFTWYFSVCPKP